jgi:hypothetical protein
VSATANVNLSDDRPTFTSHLECSAAGERMHVNAIRGRYGLDGDRVLRLFPRRVDAILLGGLRRIAGDSFDRGVRIRARYRAVATGIEVAYITVDGRAVTEIIVLPYTAQRTCR